MAWKPEYAANRRMKSQADPEYRAKRNKQSTNDPIQRKEYMVEYFKKNPEKFGRRTQEQKDAYNAARRKKYAENAAFRESHKETVRQWASANPEKKKAQRVRKYGMTPAEVDQMLESQGNACAICNHTERKEKMFPMIDHCHKTGAVRGILCSRCNMAIGLMRDSPDLLRKAIDYLLSRGSFGAT